MRQTVDKIKGIFVSRPYLLEGEGTYHLATLSSAAEMATILWEIQRAFERGILPEKVLSGTTTAYFLKDCEEKPIAVFKPNMNHEMQREVAAYRLDHGGFAQVPPTVMATFTHPLFGGRKTGSCQKFIEGGETLVCFHKEWIETLSAAQIRRIAALDIRLLNNDRHTSNLLWADSHLFPIDHALSLPQNGEGICLVWVDWPQARTPFSPEEKNYISNLDLEEDRHMLVERMGIGIESANLHFLSSLLLKKGCERGWTAYQIGSLVRKNPIMGKARISSVKTSPFQRLVECLQRKREMDWPCYVKNSQQEIERLLDDETN